MLHRIVRPAVITLLIATGIASAGFLWFTGQRIATARQQAAALDARADALTGGLADLGASLQAYVAPGQNITAWTERSAALLQQLTGDVAALGARADAAEAVAALRPGIETLTKLEARVRDYLRSGDDLMAADLAFSEARETTSGLVSALRDWRARREASALGGVRSAQLRQAGALAGVLMAWALSLGLVAWGRGTQTVVQPAADTNTETAANASPGTADAFTLGLNSARATDAGAGVDLAMAAAACADFARAADVTHLRSALGRGAEALGAKGIVVWLGVGEELFAVASHGYDERHLRRPISREANNVTAEAWCTAQAVLMPAEADGPGVVVVPMIGTAGCRGVVSAELLPGRVANADRQALLSMFAAQIAGLVGAVSAQATAQPLQAETAVAVEQLPAAQVG